jgi:hypothetical protein
MPKKQRKLLARLMDEVKTRLDQFILFIFGLIKP